MHCVVTAGPTYEPLDKVRRLTNFSTGRLGSELANYLVSAGHKVTLLFGEQASTRTEQRAQSIELFTTTANLRDLLHRLAKERVDAVFHAGAVSDFTFGKIWLQPPLGEPAQIQADKLSSREGTLLAELVPTAKIIAELREWYPKALLVGWKFEVDGGRDRSVLMAQRQIENCKTDACVVNGPAYGHGFGLVAPGAECVHLEDTASLFPALEDLLSRQRA